MKEFLSQRGLEYTEYDLSKEPTREDEMKKRTGTRIVPGIIIKKSGFLPFLSKEKVFIGFENNRDEIVSMIK